MIIGAFYYAHVVKSIPWAVIGCWPRNGLIDVKGHLPLISKIIQIRQTRQAGHCWRSKGKLISEVLLWTPSHRRADVGRLARTYEQQLCNDTGCSQEDLPNAMDDGDK